MPRYFRLIRTQYSHEETNADFARSHKTKKSQTRSVGQRIKEQLHIEFRLSLGHRENNYAIFQIRLDIYD